MIIHLDPLDSFKEISNDKLFGALGLLPTIIQSAFLATPPEEGVQEFYEEMVRVYGFGDYSTHDWGTVDDKGRYISSHEGDAPLDPICQISFPDSSITVNIYQYAMLSVTDGDATIITRMD